MDAVKFLQERSRMYESGAATPSIGLEDDYDPVSAVEIVEKWSAAHPRKTRQSVFLEQYPNAKIADDTGMPSVYPCVIEKGMKSVKYCNSLSCTDCRREFWGQEVE